MQSAGLNLLTAIASNNPTPVSEKAMEDMQGEGGASPDQQFSQLLSAQLPQNDVVPTPTKRPLSVVAVAAQNLLPLSANGGVTAQDLAAANALLLAPNMAALPQAITPAIADTLLTKIEAMMAELGDKGSQGDSWQKLKDQLVEIRDSGNTKPLDELVQTLEAVPTEALELSAAASPIDKPNLQPQVVDRAIRWLQAALSRATTKEQPQAKTSEEVAVAGLANDSTLSLQALSFRDAHTTDATDAANASGETQETRDYVEIIPLANTQIAPLPEWTAAFVAVAPANTNVPTGEIVSSALVDAKSAAQSLDARIPPLTLTVTDALPEVSLPEVALPEAKAATFSQLEAADFSAQLSKATTLSAAPVNAGILTKEMLIEATNAKDAIASANQIDAAITPTQNAQASSTQSAAAVQPSQATLGMGQLNRAPVSEQVQVAISRAKDEGMDRITIALDPVELGRVEVKMSVDRQGQTQISFLVDRAETFDALSRDARSLERALQESGIKADTGSMQFNLRQQPQPQLNSNLGGNGQPQQQGQFEETDESKNSVAAISAAPQRHYTVSVRDGVDIHA